MKTSGRVTIPSDKNFIEGTKEIAAKWGADAIRDCDGTELPPNGHEIAKKVYQTYFVVRGDNDWADKHPEETIRAFLESERVTALDKKVTIDVRKGFLKEQIEPDYEEAKRWQVYDRTTGEEVKDWEVDPHTGFVSLKTFTPFHVYSVDFLAKVLWHPVQIYNYLTNHWTVPKQKTYDPACPKTSEYIKKQMEKWCQDNKNIDVVRFTTFLYQFTLIFNEEGKEKYVDWFGYGLACNPCFLDRYEKERGFKMEAEDFVRNGMYNNPFLNPSKKFLDYMDYVQKFVSKTMRGLTDIVHSYGKEAMMFLGDDWIGSEPYGPYFQEMNLDSVVGSVGGGVTVRMLSEIPYVKVHEGRFLPYFFPDTFFEGNEKNAIMELNKNWRTARRALLRKPLDRMGFGGYLSLAAKFPSFVERVAEICDEFREIHDACIDEKPYVGVKVAILNAWGKTRSWMSHMVAHELWYQEVYSYQGILESLSGLPVDVRFISFDDIREEGIDKDINVIINVGNRDTAYSGDENWNDPLIQEKVREFVFNGGGFIGVGEPTAYLKEGRLFTLSDVLGVDEEVSLTLSEDKYNIEKKKHFITEDVKGAIDYGEGQKNIYALKSTSVLDIKFPPCFTRKVNIGEVQLATNGFGKGRSVYIAGLPYSTQNSRLLYRSIIWAAGKEEDLKKCYCEDPSLECTYYPSSKRYAIVNNGKETLSSRFFDINGESKEITVSPDKVLWLKE